MKVSLRTKMVILLMCMIALYGSLTFASNALFLKNFYISVKENNLRDIYSELVSVDFFSDRSELKLFINQIEQENNVNIYIIDYNLNSFYPENSASNAMMEIPGASYNQKSTWFSPWILPSTITDSNEIFTEQPYISTHTDQRLSTQYVSLYAKNVVDRNGSSYPYYIVMSMPITSAEDVLAIYNRFTMWTGLAVIFSALIVSAVVGTVFVAPVKKINQTARQIANLDFSGTVPVNSKDELGELSESINNLSGQLEERIRELSAANEQLQRDIEQMDRVDQMRRDLISNVSHELKTPLSIILGYCEGLQLGVNSEERDYYCSVIQDEAAKMSNLASRLLNIAELESGGAAFDLTVFDLASLAQDRLDKLGILLAERNIETRFKTSGCCYVRGDMGRIEEVLNNLLSNASNHTESGGLIEVSVCESVDSIECLVYNSGSSIPEESIAHLWESFYKVDKARTRKYGGSGLGLKIVSTILDTHCACGCNADYSAYNVQDGVVFRFSLGKAAKPCDDEFDEDDLFNESEE